MLIASQGELEKSRGKVREFRAKSLADTLENFLLLKALCMVDSCLGGNLLAEGIEWSSTLIENHSVADKIYLFNGIGNPLPTPGKTNGRNITRMLHKLVNRQRQSNGILIFQLSWRKGTCVFLVFYHFLYSNLELYLCSSPLKPFNVLAAVPVFQLIQVCAVTVERMSTNVINAGT